LDERAHLEQAGVAADRSRLFPNELHAVVVRRVMARGDHDAAVQPLGKCCEIRALGPAQPDVEHISAAVHQAAFQRASELRAGESDVISDRHAPRLYESRIGAPDVIRQSLVDLFGNAAPDVVGLEGVEVGQVVVPCRPYLSSKRTISSSPRYEPDCTSMMCTGIFPGFSIRWRTPTGM